MTVDYSSKKLIVYLLKMVQNGFSLKKGRI